ncbi:MAG: hypothetical protein ACXWLR_00215 [Myxococcales bacterium]
MRQLFELAGFVRAMRRRLRFGELSRAPIEILRLVVRGDFAECDWMTRPPDDWDSNLSPVARDESASRQALTDAMALRAMLLDELPSVRSAALRGFRASERGAPDLVLSGTVTREEPYVLRVASPVMRAKLCGFRFELEHCLLKPLEERRALSGRE